MSMLGPGAPGRRSDQVGETIASFPTYEGAQKAVSALIAADVPARHIAIVGQGLRSIERVTGRLGYATAARSGAVNGMLLGLFFSAILVLGAPTVPIQAFVGVIFVGIAIGMLLSIITYSFVRRRRDYASVMQVAADHYEVAVERDSVAKARQAIGAGGADAPPHVRATAGPATAREHPTPTETRPLPDDAAPPRYGERIPPRPDEPSVPTETRPLPQDPEPPRQDAAPPRQDLAPPRYGERISPHPDTAPASSESRALPDDAAPPRYGERIPPRPDEPPRYGERIAPPSAPGSDPTATTAETADSTATTVEGDADTTDADTTDAETTSREP